MASGTQTPRTLRPAGKAARNAVVSRTLNHPLHAFYYWGWIRDKSGTERPVRDRQGINILQIRLFEIYLYCVEHGIPCRIVGLKPRKTGLSTACQWLLYWMHRTRLAESITAGDNYDTSDTLQQIMETFIRHDDFPWPQHGGAQVRSKTNVRSQWEFSNGGIAHRETARDQNMGRGKTPQAQHRSEVAHFFQSGSFDAGRVLGGANESTAMIPGTLVIDESTPYGASGYFYTTYQGAVTFADLKAGRRPPNWNGYIRLTAFWYEFDEYTDHEATDEELAALEEQLSAHETMLVDTIGLSLAQISWRRKKIDQLRKSGGENFFLQEYVEDEVSCFLVSGRPFFSQEAIARVRMLALIRGGTIGSFTEQTNGLITFSQNPTGRIVMWEVPHKNRRYLAVADPMTGAEQVKDTGIADRHACFIMRAGYYTETKDDRKIWHQPAVVARILPPFQDETRGAIRLFSFLIRFYGDPITIVEFNNQGSAWCFQLADLKHLIYERERFDEIAKRRTRHPGWMTHKENRQTVLDRLSALVAPGPDSEDLLDVYDPHFAEEMMTFVYHSDGTPKAATGAHDDDVMALAIGAYNLDYATPYARQLPRSQRRTQNEE